MIVKANGGILDHYEKDLSILWKNECVWSLDKLGMTEFETKLNAA